MWYYFSLLVAMIIAVILEPIPVAAGLVGVTIATITGWVTPKPADALKWALCYINAAFQGSMCVARCEEGE